MTFSSDEGIRADGTFALSATDIVAHELLNALAVIRGILTRAIHEVRRSSEGVHSLEISIRACDRATRLVTHWLLGAPSTIAEREVVSLRIVVDNVVQMLRGLASPNVKIDWQASPAMPHALLDRLQIESVLLNIGANACRAMDGASGTLRVTVDAMPCARIDTPDLDRREARWLARIAVSDTGTGMDPATCARAFERQFTTAIDGDRQGLGLWMAREIVISHEGRICIESFPNSGTTVTVDLPCFRPEDAQLMEPGPLAAPMHASRTRPVAARSMAPRILCIEDHPWLLSLLRDLLEQSGYEVTTYGDPAAALRQFRNSPEDFAAVIADQRMPSMFGIDLLREIRRLRQDVALVLTSAIITDDLESRAARAGINRIVFKPDIATDLVPLLVDLVGSPFDRLRPPRDDS